MSTESLMHEFCSLIPVRLAAVYREANAMIDTPAYQRAQEKVIACDARMFEIGRAVRVDGTLSSVFALRDVVAELNDYGRLGCLSEKSEYPAEQMLAKLLRALYRLEQSYE